MGEHFVHDDRFVESFVNTEHTVLGRPLDPYCLWHHLNLEVAQSPVLLGTPMDPLSLWQAVQICTTPWTPQHTKPNLKAPGLVRFLWQAGRFNFRAEVKKFQDYFNDFNAGPKMWPNSHKNGDQSVPDRDFDENLELALYLVKESNFTWREVWTLPLGMLHWCAVGLSKLGGANLPIWTPEHEIMFEEHKVKREAGIDARGKEIAAATGKPFEEARKEAHTEYWAQVKAKFDGNAHEQSESKHG